MLLNDEADKTILHSPIKLRFSQNLNSCY